VDRLFCALPGPLGIPHVFLGPARFT
jgi:hypothetical protein